MPRSEIKVVNPKVKWTELRPVQLSVPCNCGGEMKSQNGSQQGMGPMQWRHGCDKCGFSAWYADAYPQIVYKTVETK